MTLPPPADPRLVVELAALALVRAAPDELPVLDESAHEYFADPARALRAEHSDQALGAGVTVTMLTPYLLAAAQVALPVLAAVVGEALKGVAVQVLTDRIRALFKRRPDEPPGPVALTPEQAGAVYQAVLAQCHATGLPYEQAVLIGRATVGAIHVRA